MRSGAVSSVSGFLRTVYIWQKQCTPYASLIPGLPTHARLNVCSERALSSIALPRVVNYPTSSGTRPRARFSTKRDGDGDRDEESKDQSKPMDETNNPGVAKNNNTIPDKLPDFPDNPPSSHRTEMHKGIDAEDTERVWNAFNNMIGSDEWDRLTEYEITRVIHLFNNQFSFENSRLALDRIRSIFFICEERQFVFQLSWSYSEVIRFHISEGRREEAYAIKANMDAGKYGPDVVADTDTYAAIFNDPFISTRREIAQLVELYKEMSDRGVKSDVRIDKALILFARKSEDYELLAKLLGSTSPDSIPRNHGSQAARVISARVKAYTAIHNPRLAYDELMKISSYKIPNDTRHIPKELTGSDFDNVRVPLQYNRTRDAYFLSLRSGYESLIRIRLLRKNPQMARDLLDDMRRTSYLPPTSKIYNQFIRFHAKRKNIRELRELYEMMREDGLEVTEHLYTKFMTSCMFTPKERLFNFLKKRVADKYSSKPDGGEKSKTAIELGMAASHDLPEVDGRDLGASSSGGYLGNSAAGSNGYEKSGSANSNPPDAELLAKMDKELDELIFNPGECIRFFRDMLTDYGVSPDAIQDRRYIPNASITNAVMRAYTQLRQYSLVLREFVRYCYHQKHLYPNSRPLEVEQYPRTMGYIFRMALGAARMLNDNKKSHRIYTTMREWDVRAFEKKACGYRRQ